MNAPITVGTEEVLAPEGFEIDDEDKASWAVSVIRARRRHLADLEEQHVARMARAQRELEHAERVLMPQLERYARAEIKRQTRPGREPARHIDVTTGRLQFRHRPDGLKVTDDVRALAFARLLPGAIRTQTTEAIDRERVKHGAGLLFTKTIAETLAAIAKEDPPVDGALALDRAMAMAHQALESVGVVHETERDDFSVVSGGDHG